MALRYYLPAMLWASIILVLTLSPGNYIPELPWQIMSIDKIVHLFIFGIQSFLSLEGNYRQSGRRESNFMTVVSIIILCCLYGTMIEFIQSYVPGRNRSTGDMIANVLGVFTGYLVYKIYFRNRTK